ncbi:MAG: aminodeoxychorismate synthase component I [Gammaproteobacteria bacterium]|nr:aminodeoxychorismate synthase component I [Gammaproteobacteria bacterium]
MFDLPLVTEIDYVKPSDYFAGFAALPGSVFLDSALTSAVLGRYSAIGIDPFANFRLEAAQHLAKPLQWLREQLQHYSLPINEALPPFIGGVMGFISYDFARRLERLPVATHNELQFPDLCLASYDLVMSFDHLKKRAWIIASGYPAKTLATRCARAKSRTQWLQQQLKLIQPQAFTPLTMPINMQSNFSKSNYCAAVKRAIDYIYAGDVFEVNLAQRFKASFPVELTPWELYSRLRETNPAPFAAFLNFNDSVILSASPERFLQSCQGLIETRPIKGTRGRGETPWQDQQLKTELLMSEKDRAENAMIVDLMRNDLSKVCEDFSVRVPSLCGLETYSNVHHLVSSVVGKLRADCDVVDLLQAAFPGGSITGAPKIRAMQIIEEIETVRRGPYCGSVAAFGFNDYVDSSILIRSFVLKNKALSFHVGGAVVADSDPQAEYEETLTKAKGLMQALQSEEMATAVRTR